MGNSATTTKTATMTDPSANNCATRCAVGINECSVAKPSPGEVWDCIVVGGGCAGMAAAHRLVFEGSDCDRDRDRTGSISSSSFSSSSSPREPRSLLVLEATDHVGGRTRNYDLQRGTYDTYAPPAGFCNKDANENAKANGNEDSDSDSIAVSGHIIELGGTWLSPEHTAAIQLCREHLGLDVFRASHVPEDDYKREDEYKSDNGNDNESNESNGGIDHRSAIDGKNHGDGFEEMPWWYWGMDYADEEMKRLGRTVLHLDTAGGGPPSPTTFATRRELLDGLDPPTVEQLESLGRGVIEPDCSSLAEPGANAWETPDVPQAWRALDEGSTADRCLRGGGKRPTATNARNILRNGILNKNAEEPSRVSYLYNLISWRGSNSGGPDTEYRVAGGTQAIPLRIAEKLEALQADTNKDSDWCCKIRRNTPVKRIAREDPGGLWEVTTTTTGTRPLRCKTLLVTGSPAAIHDTIEFGQDVLPAVQRELIAPDCMPMGRSLKFFAIYRTSGPWWRKHGLQGDVLACGGLPDELSINLPTMGSNGDENSIDEKSQSQIDRAPLFPYCFDVSPRSGTYGALCCFVEGASHRNFRGLPSEVQERLMSDYLELSFRPWVQDFNGKEPWIPDDFLLADWGPDAPYVGGAYTGYFPPGVLSQPSYWHAYRNVEKSPNLFWAGADYHAGFGNGYIEGAVRSGQQAADLIRKRLKRMDTDNPDETN